METLKYIRHELEKRNLLAILQLVWVSSRRWSMISIILIAIDSIFPVSILYVTKLVLDLVTSGIESELAFDIVFDQTFVFIVLLTTLSVLAIILDSLIEYSSASLSHYVTDHIYTLLEKKASEVDLEAYETPTYYDLLYRASQEASRRPADVVYDMMYLGQSGFALLGVSMLLIAFDPLIAIILMCAGLPSVISRYMHSRKLYAWHHKHAKIQRRVGYINSVLTSQDHAKENRLFGLSNYFINQSIAIRGELRSEELKITARFQSFAMASQSFTTIIIFILLTIVVRRTLSGTITIGDLVMYYEAFRRGRDFLNDFLGSIVDIYKNSLFISNLYEFFELTPTIVDPEHPKDFPQPIKQNIVVDNVSFSYPSSSRETLRNINLTINAGETIAIVGENGSGKTTLIKLLCRLYDPDNGHITVDGIEIPDFRISEFRKQISVVFQDYAHYQLSARDNIWLGNIDQPIDSDKIATAAAYSGADSVIAKLPAGFDTILGKRLDEGEELSIGEWQKIALSRAYLRDSQIIILDEPTSALDAHSEQEVFDQFRVLAKGKSTILISHRLSTIKMADRIYYLHNGEIAESGTHEELILKRGYYASMYETQAQNYR